MWLVSLLASHPQKQWAESASKLGWCRVWAHLPSKSALAALLRPELTSHA
jgi:hypothetical protein